MIDGIIRWSLHNRLVVVCAAIGVMAWGAWLASHMPVDVFPDLTAPSVSIIAEAHGMAAEEIEALLTFPIETAMNGAAGVRRTRSQTWLGIAVISVDFAWGTPIMAARQVVAERLQMVNSKLPKSAEPPMMGPTTSVMGDILFVGLTSDEHDPMTLRTLADWTIARRLLAVPGVAQVIPAGGDVRQLQVLLDPHRLDAYELTADDVAHALEMANENTSAGFVVQGGQEHLIHGIGRVQSVADIAATMITMRKGLPVQVSHVGRVQTGPALKRGDAGVSGKPGVIIGVRKQPGANTIALTARIEAELDELEHTLPKGVVLHRDLFRQADFIQNAINNVGGALRDGAVLVVFIVLLFLFSGRATLITALAIPLSLLTAIAAMRLQDIEINTMTLGGMAIAVGALVDDAIIDVENVARRLRENAWRSEAERRPIVQVVFDASCEIRRSIVFATLIIVLVFVPLFFLGGIEGRLLAPLGFAYIVSLVASLVVALTVTPVLCCMWLPGSSMLRHREDRGVVRWLKRSYGWILALTLRRWLPLTALALALLGVALVGIFQTGRAFLPAFNEGALTLSVVTLPGSSLEESERVARQVERILLDQPEISATSRRTGRAEADEHTQAVSSSEIDASVGPGDRSQAALLAALRQALKAVPGASIVIGQPISHRIDHMLSGTRARIAVKFFGPDLKQLRALAEQAKAQMAKVEGVVDLALEQQSDVPEIKVHFRRAAIARHGLTIQQVAHEIETAFQGRVVTRVLTGQVGIDLVVRYDNALVDTFDAVREARIGTPSGARLPLHALADVQRSYGPNRIMRENVARKFVVMCNVAGRDLQAVVDEIRARIDAEVPRPSGYRVAYGGQFQAASQAARTLLQVGVGVVIGIFLLLFLALRSMRDATLVLLNLPLALIGGVAGVWLFDGILSVASLIGFITLFGIATRNGIMLVTHFQHLAAVEGVREPRELVFRGAQERLSPILMTALASGLGLLPLAMAAGQPGSEIQAPMAVVILAGLASSTVLNLLILPALYLRFGAAVRTVPEPYLGQVPPNRS